MNRTNCQHKEIAVVRDVLEKSINLILPFMMVHREQFEWSYD